MNTDQQDAQPFLPPNTPLAPPQATPSPYSYVNLTPPTPPTPKRKSHKLRNLVLAGVATIVGAGVISSLTAEDEPEAVSTQEVADAAPEATQAPITVTATDAPVVIPATEAPIITEAPDSGITASQEQAVRKAEQYLDFMAFSRGGLIDQLEFDQFSNADATFAVDYIVVDWNEQAALKAVSYLDFMSFSCGSLADQLEFDQFTPAQAQYGAQQSGIC